jgi:hypothetical protein
MRAAQAGMKPSLPNASTRSRMRGARRRLPSPPRQAAPPHAARHPLALRPAASRGSRRRVGRQGEEIDPSPCRSPVSLTRPRRRQRSAARE